MPRGSRIDRRQFMAEREIPVFQRRLGERAARTQRAGVVVENVDAAPFASRRVGPLLRLAGLAEIERLQRAHHAARRFDQRHRFARVPDLHVASHHAGAVAREDQRRGAALAASSLGNQGDLAFERSHIPRLTLTLAAPVGQFCGQYRISCTKWRRVQDVASTQLAGAAAAMWNTNPGARFAASRHPLRARRLALLDPGRAWRETHITSESPPPETTLARSCRGKA